MDVYEKILAVNMGVKPGEKVLIVYDENMKKIAVALAEAAKNLTPFSEMIETIVAKTNGEEPTEEVAAKMKESDVVLCITTKSLTHTKARVNACKNNARIATMPGVDEEMLLRTMSADYGKLSENAMKVIGAFNEGKEVHVTTSLGTDFSFSIGRKEKIVPEGLIHDSGRFNNLPAGEADISPLHGSANGIVVVDLSFASVGKLEEPIKLVIENGFAVSIEGGKQAVILREKLGQFGPDAFNLAEFSFGLNEKAEITGKTIEDEKKLGTSHVALGSDKSYGGSIDVPIHLDGVFDKPTIEVDGKVIVKEGELLL